VISSHHARESVALGVDAELEHLGRVELLEHGRVTDLKCRHGSILSDRERLLPPVGVGKVINRRQERSPRDFLTNG
jgi:hypothetical protein